MTDLLKSRLSRRAVLQAATVGAAGLTPALRATVYAQGSDKPEKEEVKIGFIPLTDCASVVMASVLGFDKKYGVKIVPSKEASWAGVRDKLVSGELDMAHALYGLIYGVHLGTSGPKKEMAVLMTLSQNGQAITLSKKLADKGAVDGATADGTIINSAIKPSPKNQGLLPTCTAAACPPGANVFMNAVNDSEMYSWHTGGNQVLFADGSIHFINENISVQTLGALLTRQGGDIPGEY